MKVNVSGYVWESGMIKDFDDTYVTISDDARGIYDLHELLTIDGVHITAMVNTENGERYFTEGEVIAMGHSAGDGKGKDISVYTSDGMFLHFHHVMKYN